MKMPEINTSGEELANSLTHGLALVASLVAAFVLLQKAGFGNFDECMAALIFGLGLIILYASSFFYHLFAAPELKKTWRLLDHSSIYILIAASYTPFCLLILPATTGTLLLAVIWSIAIVGILLKIFFIGRLNWLSVVFYLGMGWAIVFAVKPLLSHFSGAGLYWLLAGGLSYTLGVVFYRWKTLTYHHAIWHVFVAGGSFCHFQSVYWYVLPEYTY